MNKKKRIVVLSDGTRAWATEKGFVRGHDIGFPIHDKPSWFWYKLKKRARSHVHPDWIVNLD